uniref:Secreted protein n=1 Tax=Heterorhabditis bacteriophora TaxID=37862 RepID=A0A1I7WB11_HETBA
MKNKAEIFLVFRILISVDECGTEHEINKLGDRGPVRAVQLKIVNAINCTSSTVSSVNYAATSLPGPLDHFVLLTYSSSYAVYLQN